jgi:predicted nucleic acid-binding protein
VALQEGAVLNVIVDTNVIVAALIRRGVVRELVLAHPGVFLTPESCIREVWRIERTGIGGGS